MFKQKGFLLLEVLLALTILSCGIVAVIKVYGVALRAQKHAQCRTLAVVLVSSLQESLEAEILSASAGREIMSFGVFEWNINNRPLYGENLEIAEINVRWKEQSREYEIFSSNIYPQGFLNKALD